MLPLRWRLAVGPVPPDGAHSFWFFRIASPCETSQPIELVLYLSNHSNLHKNYSSFGLTYNPSQLLQIFTKIHH